MKIIYMGTPDFAFYIFLCDLFEIFVLISPNRKIIYFFTYKRHTDISCLFFVSLRVCRMNMRIDFFI